MGLSTLDDAPTTAAQQRPLWLIFTGLMLAMGGGTGMWAGIVDVLAAERQALRDLQLELGLDTSARLERDHEAEQVSTPESGRLGRAEDRRLPDGT